MSGHSKWANIKIKKGKTDAQRGKVFTKLGREIAIAVKQGGPNPDANSRLKDVIAKCKAANMPNDNIARSIKKASGEGDGANYEEITYEGYGPGGVAVIVEAATDNRNRTAGDIRHYFDKFGGNLGQTGSVSYMFNKKGVILIEKAEKISEDDLMMEALEAGAEDVTSEDEYYEITAEPSDFTAVREALEAKDYEFVEAEVSMIPTTMAQLTDAKQIEQMDRLIENLEDMDDVQNVYHNWEQDEEDDEE
jgi:YebC/PmpR family DNA-binding regulatory protein